MIDKTAVEVFTNALSSIGKGGWKSIFGGKVLHGKGFEVRNLCCPCIAEAENITPLCRKKHLHLLLYLMKYETIEEAIAYSE